MTPEVSLEQITVRFGTTVALDKVSLRLPPGSRVAVVGENGAGKSTLMKVLFGLNPPDSGQLLLNGQPRRFTSPRDAITAGIGMVQQHFDLIGPFTVAENIVLGCEPRLGLRFDRRRAEAEVAALAERSGLSIDPAARVETLSVAAQQRVEILKALYRQAKILILDEPTATLAPAEARELWAATRRLSAQNTTVVFVTHKLDDVMAQADSVTVLRRGKQILSVPVAETNPATLAAAMIGESETPLSHQTKPQQTTTSNHTVTLDQLCVLGDRGNIAVDGVTLTLQPGEILGLAGVDGSGQSELIEALVGLRPLVSGTLQHGTTRLDTLSIAQRRAHGLAYIPEDRHRHAVAQSLSLAENTILGRQRETLFVKRGGLLDKTAIQGFMSHCVQEFDVRGAERQNAPFRALSGGNQQKLVLARELSREPRFLIAAQPTRGLDFAATAFVHQALRRAADAGAAVLVQSLDLDEVRALSDRVAVMLAGKLVAVLDRADATEERLGALMTGAER